MEERRQRPALVAALTMLASLAVCSAASAQFASGVSTQQDPFARLADIDAGRIASSWSSLPHDVDCAGTEPTLSGHAMALGEAGDAKRDAPSGRFDLIQPRYRAQLDATAQWDCVTLQVALQRQADSSAGWTWDGSALSWRIGTHWQIGAGRIARQWGPGWDGSLILGTAARPILSAGLAANSGPLEDSALWWWLGEVDVQGFIGQVDGDRGDFDRPTLMGLRLVLRPWEWLQIGLSRVAMWGGRGRDNSLRTFLKAVAGAGENEDGNTSLQPGNQLAGFDLRWDASALLSGVALYGQMIGEDEAGHLPSKQMTLAGAEWHGERQLAFVEWAETKAGPFGVAYNHHLYTDGYRYQGRSLGHWADGDATLWTVGGLHDGLWGGQGLAALRWGTLNEAGVNRAWPSARLAGVSLQWRKALARWASLTLALQHDQLSPIGGGGRERDTQAFVQVDLWLD